MIHGVESLTRRTPSISKHLSPCMLLHSPRLAFLSRNPNLQSLNLCLPRPRALTLASLSPMAPPEIAAEYAKSGRSTCKSCGKPIAVGSLRLGLSSKDPRGFDAVKWHHLDCFPSRTQPLGAAEEIKGFSSLTNGDQEALKKLEAASSDSSGKELSQPKKEKGSELNLSVSDIKEKYKRLVEYAKSSRSSCKSCGETIKLGFLRLGLSSKDPRGFDLVKWHHLDCFPAQALLFGALEEIEGFSSLKNYDQDALMKLKAAALANQSDKEVHKRDDSTGIGKTGERSSKKPKIHNGDDDRNVESEEQNPEEVKLSEPGKERVLDVDFSFSDIKDKYKVFLLFIFFFFTVGILLWLSISLSQEKYNLCAAQTVELSCEQDASLSPKWKVFKTIIFREREDGLHDSEKIAAFDFDGCLANTSVKRIGPDAWSLMYPSIPEKLQELYNSGYKLVIFTNESNIERWKNKRQQAVDSKIGRLDNFIKHVKVPFQVFIACGLGKSKDQTDDPFRKPKPGMWTIMEGHFNSGIAIDMVQSFYVGDAAGRVNDHSDADIKFAQAIGLKFYVPEEFFGA